MKCVKDDVCRYLEGGCNPVTCKFVLLEKVFPEFPGKTPPTEEKTPGEKKKKRAYSRPPKEALDESDASMVIARRMIEVRIKKGKVPASVEELITRIRGKHVKMFDMALRKEVLDAVASSGSVREMDT